MAPAPRHQGGGHGHLPGPSGATASCGQRWREQRGQPGVTIDHPEERSSAVGREALLRPCKSLFLTANLGGRKSPGCGGNGQGANGWNGKGERWAQDSEDSGEHKQGRAGQGSPRLPGCRWGARTAAGRGGRSRTGGAARRPGASRRGGDAPRAAARPAPAAGRAALRAQRGSAPGTDTPGAPSVPLRASPCPYSPMSRMKKWLEKLM